jgi:glycosyltransferase involved in cell wall biosynthesis
MKILILTDHFGTGGGAGTIAMIEAQHLAHGHEALVLAAHSPAGFNPAEYQIRTYNLDYHPRWRNYLGLYHPRAIKILQKELNRFRPQEVYLHNIHTNWSYYCLRILRSRGIKSVITLHDVVSVTPYVKFCNIPYSASVDGYRFQYRYSWWRHLQQAKFAFNPFRNFFIRRFLRLATVRYAVSQALASFLNANGIEIDKVVHNKIPDLKQAPSEIFDDTIFFGGRLFSSKGALEAVKYLHKLREKYKLEVKLRIVGAQGPITEKMFDLARRLGVENLLNFTGWLDETRYQEAMRDCGVVIVPSICFDSLPTVVLEAMRAARPVVATIFGGSGEMVEDGKTGFIRDPLQTEEFTAAIAALIRDKKLAREFGRQGRLRFQKDFSIDV